MTTPQEKESWHLSKNVPIALIVGLVGQMVIGIWFAAQFQAEMRGDVRALDKRVEHLERGNVVTEIQVLQARVASLELTASRIDSNVGKIIDRQLQNHGNTR